VLSAGVLEAAVLKRKSTLQAALTRLLVKKKMKSVEELVGPDLASEGIETGILVRLQAFLADFSIGSLARIIS
jgi:hypothetical protein